MTPADAISAAIKKANAAERTALVPFFTAGYPEPDAFIDTLRKVAECGDVVELGVPFSDPMADGLTIQRSSHAAIQAGVSLSWILDSIRPHRDSIAAPLVLMSYLNPLLAYGLDRLAADALSAGIGGFIVPDLPLEECAPIHAAFSAKGLALIQLVTPATPAERLERLAAVSDGFVYAVTVRGITGGGRALPAATAEYLAAVARAAGDKPVCAGFGIRAPEQVAEIGSHVNGAVVGSALIEAQERGDDIGVYLKALRGD